MADLAHLEVSCALCGAVGMRRTDGSFEWKLQYGWRWEQSGLGWHAICKLCRWRAWRDCRKEESFEVTDFYEAVAEALSEKLAASSCSEGDDSDVAMTE
eukprot:CAMPEP_0204576392 /NCGR_PEP_ID=MMETSP0661-20131031/41746_1 /ASSEMBLY_ACC=CAM_ASM_000606 /TAXON_ID=109239 /ORGANISM="Alexandrium margalefi, Strain AMGDE01CS-322" /LENGTH=98 /DNA_ID=CAMNT_0051585131 /DNA_START=43 /DNA_END=339 /DNA_ORIENTATION=+